MFFSKWCQITIITVALLAFTTAQEDEHHDPDLHVTTELPNGEVGIFFNPTNLTKTRSGISRFVQFETIYFGVHHVTFSVANEMVSIVTGFEFEADLVDNDGNTTGSGSFNVSALFVGYNVITLTIYDENNNILGAGKLQMSVVLSYQKMNEIFTYILVVLVALVYVSMGATLDLQVVKQIAKKPIGPIVGIICQYGFMPVIAFGLAKLFFSDDQFMQLGLFLNGASPGGGSSNMWTLILGGSLDLSIMMTFVSTIVAFAAIPLWVLVLGPQIIGADSQFKIPYAEIAMVVVLLVVPCLIGIGLQFCSPKLAKFLEEKILKPFSIFMIIFIFSFGIYSYRYVFQLVTWKVFLSCLGLPGLGYLGGIIMSIITRRSLADTVAISIETGVQNVDVAIIILKVTLEAPLGDLAIVIPTFSFLVTPIPLLLAIVVKKVYGRIKHSGGKDITTDENIPKNEKIVAISLDTAVTICTPELDTRSNNYEKLESLSKSFKEGVDNPCANFKDEQVCDINVADRKNRTKSVFKEEILPGHIHFAAAI